MVVLFGGSEVVFELNTFLDYDKYVHDVLNSMSKWENLRRKKINKCGVTTSNIIYIPTSIRLTPFQLRATTFSCILEHARHETNVYYKSLAFNYVIETIVFFCVLCPLLLMTTAYHKVSIIIVICDCVGLEECEISLDAESYAGTQ